MSLLADHYWTLQNLKRNKICDSYVQCTYGINSVYGRWKNESKFSNKLVIFCYCEMHFLFLLHQTMAKFSKLHLLCIRCQQVKQLLVIEAGPDELTPGHPPVIVDVHPLEYPRRPLLNSNIVIKSFTWAPRPLLPRAPRCPPSSCRCWPRCGSSPPGQSNRCRPRHTCWHMTVLLNIYEKSERCRVKNDKLVSNSEIAVSFDTDTSLSCILSPNWGWDRTEHSVSDKIFWVARTVQSHTMTNDL